MYLIPDKVDSYKCIECGELYNSEYNAMTCMYNHIKQRLINIAWENGFTLHLLNYNYGLNLKLDDNQKNITKDSCFIISYLQCCDKPAYQIINIDINGKITVGGKGSWSSPYSSIVSLDCLKNPRPLSELYVDSR